MQHRIDSSHLLSFKLLNSQRGIKHFSSTRNGGVSNGKFQSFNLGNYSEDKIKHITKNRQILADKLSISAQRLVTPHQTHGNRVLHINSDFIVAPKSIRKEMLYGYDATITQEQGVFLCVTTADCAPILLYDKPNKAVAAIHAGWRGIVNLIIDNTITEMKRQYGSNTEDLIAAIGPSIGIDAYEVGDEVINQLQQSGYRLDSSNYLINSLTQKQHIDIKQLNKQKLMHLGVTEDKIEISSYCTYTHKDLFFSARRQGIESGRMLTGIMLE